MGQQSEFELVGRVGPAVNDTLPSTTPYNPHLINDASTTSGLSRILIMA